MRFTLLVIASALVAPASVRAQQGAAPPAPPPASPSTSAVFRRFSDRVVKIQVIENGSGAKASLGSGFFVDGGGTVVTNYHVVAQIVNDPARYHATLTDPRGATLPVSIAAIDVVHDLAVVRSVARPSAWFALDSTPVDQGDRIYAMGHPLDLGLAIVEGTYNGLLAYTLYPKIHFTANLNPGMSGGPAITADGRVIGVNVSTAGNAVSFLVPAARAQTLLAHTPPGRAPPPPSHLLADVARQIRTYQDVYLRDLFAPSGPTIRMGSYTLPTKPAAFFKCWGDAEHGRETRYAVATHMCSTDDMLFISEDQQSGIISITHELLTTTDLSPTQFYALYQGRFAGTQGVGMDVGWGGATEENVTKFQCRTHNVANGRTKMRVAFCARAYKKLPGLYDAMTRVATLGATNAGVVSTLRLSGVSFANARALTERFVRSIAWSR